MAAASDITNAFHFEPFTSVPVLDLALADNEATKPIFLSWLRYALINTGTWHLTNHGVDEALLTKMKELSNVLFDLPANEEARLEETNSPHFWGLTRVGRGTTDGKRDYREDYDLGNDLPSVWKEGDPLYVKTRPGPNLWPSDEFLPDFKTTVKSYIASLAKLGDRVNSLIEEAIGLPKGTFDAYRDDNVKAGGRIKIARYPPLEKIQSDGQQGPKFGVGPHKDLWLTFALPTTNHAGEEVANPAGTWIPCSPLDGVSSFLVYTGSALESVTRGGILATPHRSMNPQSGDSRITINYFHEISPHVTFAALDKGAEGLNQDLVAQAKARRRWWVLRNSVGKSKLQQIVDAAKRATDQKNDSVEAATDADKKKPQWPTPDTPIGEVFLVSRIKSRPKVARKFYPELADLILGKEHPHSGHGDHDHSHGGHDHSHGGAHTHSH